jgi:ribosomal protein S18 acetylase RimI-like enzyme
MRPLSQSDLEAVRLFTDREIGTGYYSIKELQEIFLKSQKDGVMCSYLLESPESGIQGIRISYPPGRWSKGKGQGLHPELWPHPLESTAYFQSLFLSSALQGQGWGGQLSMDSIRALQKTGARGVVCHSWKESPNGSSSRYLHKLGFELIAEHPKYWKDVPYNCTRCGSPPCQCTAQEMYLNLERIL